MIKRIIKFLLYGNKSDSRLYIKHLRKVGCEIGDHTTIYSPQNTIIDETRPYLIKIGNNVEITAGCTILTHGYDWCIYKTLSGDILGSAGEVVIGDNVFIGVNTTILKGVHIGNNVIIGACSLINRDIPDNVVVAGNPAKIICSIEDYYQKRLDQQLPEALSLYKNYCKKYNTDNPPADIFYEFFWLFENETEDGRIKNPQFRRMMELGGTTDLSYHAYSKREKPFKNYDEFIAYCKKHASDIA